MRMKRVFFICKRNLYKYAEKSTTLDFPAGMMYIAFYEYDTERDIPCILQLAVAEVILVTGMLARVNHGIQ